MGGALLLILAACGGGGTGPTFGVVTASPGSQGPAAPANACSAAAPGPKTYPGWPGGTNPVAVADIIPEVVSTELAVGPNRFLMTIIDSKNNLVASASVPVDLRFYDLAKDPATAASSMQGTFLDSGNGLGLYRASVTFSCSGDWGVEVIAHRSTGDGTARVVFQVEPQTTTPAIGAPAPHVDTPTATDAAGIARVSTDPSPDPDFYRLTITQAVTSGKPALIIFATPAFCRTAVCGPTLNRVKSVAAGFAGLMDFVHVEPYVMQWTGTSLQPVLDASGNLQPIPADDVYGLQTEPYTFVVDSSGRIAAKFEAMVGADELTSALQAVTGQPGASIPPSTAPAPTSVPAAPAPAAPTSAPAAPTPAAPTPAAPTPAPSGGY